MALMEFLTARLDENEATAEAPLPGVVAIRRHLARYQMALLRQQAKPGDEQNNGYTAAMSQVLQDDAAVWSGHPDYGAASAA